MANFHVRSNSLPSKSDLVVNDVEDHLCRLKSSEEASTSSATAVSANLVSLGVLHEGMNHLIQMPSVQQALIREDNEKWINQLLEESLGHVDLCGFVRDVLNLTKESVQELQSYIRRSRSETATTENIHAYKTSRKGIKNLVSTFIKNFESIKKNSAPVVDEDSNVTAVVELLKETAAIDFLVLTSALVLLSGENERSTKRSWSLLSHFTQTSQDVQKQLKSSEAAIQELEDELEPFYRTLVKTRVSLLNALNH